MRAAPETLRRLTRDQVGRVGAELRALGKPAHLVPANAPATADLAAAAALLGVARQDVLRGLAGLARVPYVDLRTVAPEPAALAAFPEALARRFHALPLTLEGRMLTLAIAEVGDWRRFDDLATRLPAYSIAASLADPELLVPLIERHFPLAGEDPVERWLLPGPAWVAPGELTIGTGEQPPTVAMVDLMLSRAVALGVSDVHVEPATDHGRVRYRLDGHLRTMFTYDRGLHEALIARLKILAELDIVDRMRPQDGRLTIHATLGDVDARIGVLRMADGEKAVVRVLGGPRQAVRPLDRLGFTLPQLRELKGLLAQPNGLILVVGPTGSGKTSTLYGALDHLNAGDRNLVTIEDPVEYRLPGVNQVPVRADLDVSFAGALRAILRQDPDVVMVGEIRDRETADIAVRGALTGHLLMATLHANGSVEAIARLLEMGVPGASLAPALLGVVAQRLVRKLCVCRGFALAPRDVLVGLGLADVGPVMLPVARGCEACDGSGYRGRMPVFEVLTVDREIKRLVAEGGSPSALAEAARAGGLAPMAWQALEAVLAGLTTVEEIERAVPRPY